METIFSKLIGLLENFYLAAYIIAGSALGIGLELLGMSVFHSEFWFNVGYCYFAGMLASRIGSLIVEYACEKLKFIKREPYLRFLEAEKKDSTNKLNSMSKVNGTYQTMTAVSLILLVVSIIQNINSGADWMQYLEKTGTMLCISALFLFSYRKQTNYIVNRINFLLQ